MEGNRLKTEYFVDMAGNSPLTYEERNKYDNLILMCKVHHKIIDDQPNTYTVEVLKSMKAAHIRWVNEALNLDKLKQKMMKFTLFILKHGLS